jgi:phosphohistidine phosphatase
VPHTLVVIRHAKSDWEVAASDRDRPLATRGRRQAPVTGAWLAAEGVRPDLAIVSPAERARATWALVAAELEGAVPTRIEEAAYTFDGDDLLDLVRATPEDIATLALVGHNPAVEELLESLTREWVRMPTSALAVVELPSWTASLGSGRVAYAGRPAD